MDVEIRAAVADLAGRVARLEAAAAPWVPPAPAGTGMVGTGATVPPDGRVGYGGSGPWEGSAIAWQMERSWDEVLTAAGEHVARVVAALASATRLRIVAELVGGPLTTADLSSRLDQPTSGQLFHHLKELLAVGVVHQPRRGTYALRPQHVLPVLTVISAAADLTSTGDVEPS